MCFGDTYFSHLAKNAGLLGAVAKGSYLRKIFHTNIIN
ncbi:hypothetical protein LDG_6330 [Legionella drancourtii LLAP12]|uniref:Uncharacterized protein n=1 Tax=Legionella drancourtii LLAP12 TaxID=658187 RepID=G9EM68_9GAMM|nr:hypothetical protein LDG_6330 [Legionella drancourtii LLAP12]